jgi:hypothetical protein
MLGPMENWVMLLLAAVVVFLLFREFWCWYWKQSEQVNLLKEIRDSLRRLEAAEAPPARRDGPHPGPEPDPARGWRDRVLDRMAGVP